MKNRNGITLISLVVTIVVLLILASITTYSGISTIKSSKLTKFKQELEIMQAEVDALYEKYKNEETITVGKDISNADTELVNANTAFNELSTAKQAEYRYFDVQTIQNLDVAGIEREFLVNIKDRDVISLEGFTSDGVVYYRLEDISGNKKVSGSIERDGVTFSVTSEVTTEGTWRIIVSNIEFSKYVGKGKIQYALKDSSSWTTVDTSVTSTEYKFTIKKEGTYIIRITDAAGEIGEVEITL